jgi:hypothetical protein
MRLNSRPSADIGQQTAKGSQADADTRTERKDGPMTYQTLQSATRDRVRRSLAVEGARYRVQRAMEAIYADADPVVYGDVWARNYDR